MADILISGIEMPKIGKITLDIYYNGEIFEKRGSERIGYAKATELPPHGDLIERDAVLESDPLFFAPKYGGDHRRNYDTMMGYEIGNMLRDAPVIVEATE